MPAQTMEHGRNGRRRAPLPVALRLAVLFSVLSGCSTASPILNPVGPVKGTEHEPGRVTVLVRPVVTSGLNNPERKRFGMDVSAHFSAFEVTIVNRTDRKVSLDSSKAVLLDSQHLLYRPLSGEEALDYYRYGESDPNQTVVLVPKARKILRSEAERLQEIRLRSAETIEPEQFVKGVLFFRKVPKERCEDVALKIEGVRIEGEEEARRFSFPFSCPGPTGG